jgi:hypothetical protein
VTVSEVMPAYTNDGKTTSAKRNDGRKSALTKIGHHIVPKNHRTIVAQVTAELNIHLEDPVSTKTL